MINKNTNGSFIGMMDAAAEKSMLALKRRTSIFYRVFVACCGHIRQISISSFGVQFSD